MGPQRDAINICIFSAGFTRKNLSIFNMQLDLTMHNIPKYMCINMRFQSIYKNG